MLEELRIRDLGVITDAALPLGPGLSVVTGETGAGKTMVVTAVGLLLGARSDAGAVRSGAKSASAEAVLKLDPAHSAVERAKEAGGEAEEFDGVAELLLARTVGADGRSRAYVGGRAAPVGVLAELGESLVVVHGQSDQIRLKSATAQRHALDRFAGAPLAKTLGEYQELFNHWKAIQSELETLRREARERLREAESLDAALKEIDEVDPQAGEDETLKAEAVKLANVEELRLAAAAAHESLIAEEFGDAGDATTMVDAAKRTLEHVAEHDEELGSAAKRLAEVGFLLNDIAAELSSYQAALDTEGPERLSEIEDRRAALAKLIRKYAPSIDEVLEWATTARTRLDELQDDSSRIESLDAEVASAEASTFQPASAPN
jgi:DNA repair protein RecN (Recombination protein N)